MSPAPEKISLAKTKQTLTLNFKGESFALNAELLRVLSPSAEVQGHSPEQKQTVLDKQEVRITHIEMQGHYAIRLTFDDGHDSGIYSWEYLYTLCKDQSELWQIYLKEAALERTKQEGTSPVKWV